MLGNEIESLGRFEKGGRLSNRRKDREFGRPPSQSSEKYGVTKQKMPARALRRQ